MGIVLMLHSLLRFVILVVAIVGLLKALVGLARGSAADKFDQMLAAAFVGSYDLQALLGMLVIFLGGLTEPIHPVVMFVGIVAAHGLQMMTKRAEGQQAKIYRLLLFIVPLAIILFGLAVIGKLPT
ncbi:MAG: hypothetical protein HZB51_31715 [Chloroflexi bacterium]|nr:hypothetical protein [Chloroflexota bacterium]